MHIQVLTRPYPGKILHDAELDPLTPPKRITITDHQLARHLNWPRDLVRQYLESGQLHVMRPGEREAKAGLSSEEIACLTLLAHIHQRHDVPFKKGIRIAADLRKDLLVYTDPARVLLVVTESNKGWHALVTVGQGDIEVSPGIGRWTTVFDAGRLAALTEEAFHREPLRLPSASACVVSR